MRFHSKAVAKNRSNTPNQPTNAQQLGGTALARMAGVLPPQHAVLSIINNKSRPTVACFLEASSPLAPIDKEGEGHVDSWSHGVRGCASLWQQCRSGTDHARLVPVIDTTMPRGSGYHLQAWSFVASVLALPHT